MIKTKVIKQDSKITINEKTELIDFLYTNLEQYGDMKADIEKSIDYALKITPSFGGFVLVSYSNDEITGVVVINQTGMKGYIPENILVYIATHKNYRGQGIGKLLMEETIKLADGNIALHVEPDNPAKFLYEKYGFSSKYIEMRYVKK